MPFYVAASTGGLNVVSVLNCVNFNAIDDPLKL